MARSSPLFRWVYEVSRCVAVFALCLHVSARSCRRSRNVQYQQDTHGQVKIRHGATRWEEACSKVRHIVAYNISREMQTVVFLLNPKRECRWRANEDYCIIDPKAGKAQRKNVQLRLEAMVRQIREARAESLFSLGYTRGDDA